MKKLFDAFLELPTWQGILLLTAFALIIATGALVVSRISFRAGVRYAKNIELWRKWNLR
jgi:hypothetical protein